MTEEMQPLLLFVAYARTDEQLKLQLLKHLSTTFRTQSTLCWHDRCVEPGEIWEKEISDNLNSAHIILLLISSDFIASDYCYSIEMQRALERNDVGDACVIPVIVRDCDWKVLKLGKLQAVPRDGKPVTSWTNVDEALTDAAVSIRKRIQSLNSTRAAQQARKLPLVAPTTDSAARSSETDAAKSADSAAYKDICPQCKTEWPVRCTYCKKCFVCSGIRPSFWNSVIGGRGGHHCGCGSDDGSHIACS